MQRNCKQCNQQFEITDDDLKFYEKIKVPSPTLCFKCRNVRKFAFRNDLKLYRRKCDLCKIDILSLFSPNTDYIVYCPECYRSDQWDALKYGIDYNPDKSFFEQFNDLYKKVPQRNLWNYGENVNSDYCNSIFDCKDCYLSFFTTWINDCYYIYDAMSINNCVDCYKFNYGDNCYEIIMSENCHNSSYIYNSSEISDSKFLFNCQNCDNCVFSANLNHKSYCIWNKEYSKEDYFKELEKYDFTNYNNIQNYKEQFSEFKLKFPIKYSKIINCENCTGNNDINSKNCIGSYDVINNCEECKYSINIAEGVKNSYDLLNAGLNLDTAYESFSIGDNSNNIFFSLDVLENCYNIFYSGMIRSCHDLFGCVGLKHKEYCILNKQYTKEEYEKLVEKIKSDMLKRGEYGEFFSPSISNFGYNETIGIEFFPMTKEEALNKGYKWSDYSQESPYSGPWYIPNENIAYYDNEEHAKELLSGVLKCEVTGKPFKVIPQELAFCLKQRIPISRKCFEQRNRERFSLRSPYELWDRNCMKCGKEIKTSYAPERKEIVYCDRCYQDEVY